MEQNPYLYDIVQVRPKALIIYPYFEYSGKKKSNKFLFWNSGVVDENKTKGKLSENSIRRLKYAIQLLIASSVNKKAINNKTGKEFNFKINFITLTLPSLQENYTDEFIKRNLLNSFLQDCKRYYSLNSYVWKAEAQENGNIHFHITTDCYIDAYLLRKLWNKQLKKTELINNYRNNMRIYHEHGFRVREDLLSKWSLEQQREAYNYGCKTNWSNPNTTDVHSVKKIKDLCSYLIKYMSKSEECKRPIKGKIWNCSKNLNYTNKFELEVFGETANFVEKVSSILEHKIIKSDFCKIIPFSNSEFEQLFPSDIKLNFEKFISNIRFKET